MTPHWLAWSLTFAALIHIFEEFVWPGGFKAWWLSLHPEITKSVTTPFLVGINALLVVMCVLIAFAVQAPRGNGVAAWLTFAALLAANGVFHVAAATRTRRYSPGMISGVALYLPLAVYGYFYFLRNGRASWLTAIISALLGSSYYFIALANHRRRARHL